MSLMDVTDYSKWQREVSRASHAQMRAAGVEGFVVGLWHGIDNNPYALNSLSNGRAESLYPSGYAILNAKNGRDTIREAKNAAGFHWPYLFGVAVDIELRVTPATHLERVMVDAIDEIRVQGQRPYMYTGNWFWNWWVLELGRAPRGAEDVGAWIAVYNGIKDLASAGTRPGYGPIVGHQYTGSTSAFGTTGDFNVFDRAWVMAG